MKEGTMPGRFVDEIYYEDEEEAMQAADEEARRAARMLGFLFVLVPFVIVAIAIFILWPRGG